MTPEELHELAALRSEVSRLQVQVSQLVEKLSQADQAMLIMLLATRQEDNEAFNKYMNFFDEKSKEVQSGSDELFERGRSMVEEKK